MRLDNGVAVDLVIDGLQVDSRCHTLQEVYHLGRRQHIASRRQMKVTYRFSVPSTASSLEKCQMAAERGRQADRIRVGLELLVRDCLLHGNLATVSI